MNLQPPEFVWWFFKQGEGRIMRLIFILVVWLIFRPVCAVAAENLIENLTSHNNVTMTNGTVNQITADSRDYLQWKVHVVYNNTRHQQIGDISYESLIFVVDNSLGIHSITVTMPDDLEDLSYFRFGLNGTEIDTLVRFDIKNVMPNKTYTIQWRVLNNAQGTISWSDMYLVSCADGYELALGDTECSVTCENRATTGGHIPPDSARVYAPGVCTYTPSNLVCDDGWTRMGAACERLCTAGISRLHYGGKSTALYDRKIGAPALCVQYNGRVCYGRLATGENSGLNVELNGSVYHLID